MDKKVYELKIDLEQGLDVNVISIVTEPATEEKFYFFGKQDVSKQMFEAIEEEYELHGIAMIPNKMIVRYDEIKKEEYDVFFSEKTVRNIAKNYFKQGYHTKINLQHSDIFIDAYVFMSNIIDRKRGYNPPDAFIDAVDGSWIVGMQLDKNSPHSKTVFENIKKGVFTGFSIEGYFMEQLTQNFNTEYADYLNALDELEKELDAIITEKNIKI